MTKMQCSAPLHRDVKRPVLSFALSSFNRDPGEMMGEIYSLHNGRLLRKHTIVCDKWLALESSI